MKRNVFRLSWLILVIGLAILQIYWAITAVLVNPTVEKWFLSFCFCLVALVMAFEAYLIIKSRNTTTYYLPDLFFEDDGKLNKFPYYFFAFLGLASTFCLFWFSLQLGGVNLVAPKMDTTPLELIISFSAVLFINSVFPLIFGVYHRHDGFMKQTL
jgi:hypothetical protein